ncbi:asparagine synthase (glutamine-hydrolyzing) [Aequorivita echinoideorum]|uniref:asparagine synthase (glutamine-hydrolyzing) n=1 Tax=Aequorivita echinoideorum TaxID=1549647 RepID=A0ABS5S3Y9_9FLAO|nr:asparagine synthase (glutamine-hydrolyzing) [Aequorivita echinoideorum]MBT0607928.1 asparagine synthase (glutamine-hydrolyzing) [Aequorivita echinoideorum]
MCGINGIFEGTPKIATGTVEKLQQMNRCIIHRGPDDDGVYHTSNADYSVAMGMRRLAIIDLESGKQPIQNEDGSKVIVFNGEIYNYRQLRESLLLEGVSFKTTSDTEVILRLYEKHGTAAFGMLDGMFAFSIYDKIEDTLYIVRDYFGEKPLYYKQEGNRLYWASELKSILAVQEKASEISKEGLNLYFQLTYIPAPHTIYEGIYKLEADHYIAIDCKRGAFDIHPIEHQFKKYDLEDKSDVVRKNHDLVQESVLSRSVADVPLGTFLSGGVDSSIISLSLAQQKDTKIDTFSIGFEKKSFDETDKSREVAKLIGSKHHEFIIGEADLADNLDAILLNFDEPFADSSALASYVVANKTRAHVMVALTGDGGDEVYGGYNKYYMANLNQKYTRVVPQFLHEFGLKAAQNFLTTKSDNRGKRFKINRLLKAIDYEGGFYYGIISLGFQENELDSLLKENWQAPNGFNTYKETVGTNTRTLTDFRNIDRILSLEGDMLVKVDRTSMLTSLECRAPFLNKALWNFTQQVPENYLLKGWDKKHLLKESFKRYFPDGFLDKSKKGFGVPVGDWLRTILRPELEKYAQRDFIEKQGIFKSEAIIPIVEKHISGKQDNTFRVWTFYCFQKWYTKNFR